MQNIRPCRSSTVDYPPNVVTDIEDFSKAVQKCTTKQPSTESIGEATATSTILNHAVFLNEVKDIYLDKDNPYILITGDTMTPFNE